MATALERARLLAAKHDPARPEILRAGDVSLPVRQTACRACAQPYDGQHRRPFTPRVSMCCTRWDGTHLACPPRTQPSPAASTPAVWTAENIATMRAVRCSAHGVRLRFVARIGGTCHPEYYRHEQKMFLDFLLPRISRVRTQILGPLESSREHGAGQRTGDRGSWLALGRAGRKAPAVRNEICGSPAIADEVASKRSRHSTAGRSGCG